MVISLAPRTQKGAIPLASTIIMEMNTECRYCGKRIHRSPSKLKNKSGVYFCCRDHKDLSQKYSSNIPEIRPHSFIDGRRINYRKVVDIKECGRCGFNQVAEILIVHHKDRNRKNNSIINLEVLCPNCHDLEHFYKKDGRFVGKFKN